MYVRGERREGEKGGRKREEEGEGKRKEEEEGGRGMRKKQREGKRGIKKEGELNFDKKQQMSLVWRDAGSPLWGDVTTVGGGRRRRGTCTA